MEERLANWITRLVGGSYVLLAIFAALVILAIDLSRGDYDILYSPTTAKFTVVGVLYIVSLYFVATLVGKSIKRRIYSWLFSVVFHAGLLVYIGIALELGGVAMIVGMPETVILLLSSVGLILSVRSINQENV